MITVKLPHRGTDDFGYGHFGAPRGTHRSGTKKLHKGIDYACYPGTKVYSPCIGEITKFGYPYAAHLEFRYIEVTDEYKARHRLFYTLPMPDLELGDLVTPQDIISEVQDIASIYSTKGRVMKNHLHYEILLKGKPVNPETYGS